MERCHRYFAMRNTANDPRLLIEKILHEYWGFSAFRPLQEDIILSVLEGRDTLALLPTGGGKSLCYQVPALANDGLCLVITPLIALMKDQVEGLRRKNITALSIHSGMTRYEVINTLTVAGNSNCKFLFVSPERLETVLFREYLPGLNIQLIAVDEAHCISQWGYDFRPSYLRIALLREELPGIPVLALTASATPAVQQDICKNLQFTNHQIFRQSFERPNLSYSVFRVDSKINKILEILQTVPGSSIIYCKTRKRTREISDLLRLQEISSDYYHAGLATDDRNRKQEAWIQNNTRVIVCTNAFGMGIDKPDVRTVIHADVPDCLENYYQEAGRAGRDNKTSYAVLLHDREDLQELEALAGTRYPSPREIQEVYQAVANYLQIPAGSGEGEYFEFDINTFLKRFEWPVPVVLNALKILEQEGWLAFNEQVFVPASVVFTTNRDYLQNFEATYPHTEPLIKTLLRSYEGIFDQACAISEKWLAGLLKIEIALVKTQLMQLHQAGIVVYEPQKDTPQVFFPQQRIKAADLRFDIAAIQKRKEQFMARMRQMMQYVKEEAECRSRMIGTYFGDRQIRPCGICDNCRRQRAARLIPEEFDTLHHRIINMVKYETLHTRDLLQKLNDINKEKAWKVIEFLQAENKIEMDNKGLVRLK